MSNIQFSHAISFVSSFFRLTAFFFSLSFVCLYIDRVIRAQTSAWKKPIGNEKRKKQHHRDMKFFFFNCIFATLLNYIAHLFDLHKVFIRSFPFICCHANNKSTAFLVWHNTVPEENSHCTDYATKFLCNPKGFYTVFLTLYDVFKSNRTACSVQHVAKKQRTREKSKN